MEPIKLGDLLRGVAVTKKPDVVITSVTTDSRKAGPGSLFVAIPGENLDGNDYAQDALDRGAEDVIISRRQDLGGQGIVVRSTRDALIQMAGNYRSRYNPKVAGVTGSVGKTTTKEMLAAIFQSFGKTIKSVGNQNNEIGLPGTVFKLDASTELAVFEMGMNKLGDISKLTRCVRPRAAVITAIGVSHLEMLGSRENILKAKLEIVEGLPSDGVLALNGDDEMLMGARDSVGVFTTTFAIHNTEADIIARDVMTRIRSTEFTIQDRLNGSFKAIIPCAGLHNVMDALGAYSVATRLGLDPALCASSLEKYSPTGMRQNFVDFMGITVIEDCYNASPDSMRASLETLAELPIEGLKVAVLGDMLELGDITYEAHRDIGMLAASMGIDILLCYGANTTITVEAARAAGINSAEHFNDKRDMAEYLRKTMQKGDAVMFKASRAMAFEDVIEMFYEI